MRRTREWLLEDRAAPEHPPRWGVMDLLVFDGEAWWLLDYKTSRPGDPGGVGRVHRPGAKEHYRPQLLAYREMAARAKGLRLGGDQAGPLFHRLPAGGGGVRDG